MNVDIEMDKDQILTHFQDVTGIQDLGECFQLLEDAQWNLEQATHAYLNGQNYEPQMPDIIDDDIINTVQNNRAQNVSDLRIEGDHIPQPQPQQQVINSRLQDIAYSNFFEPRRYLNFTVEFRQQKEDFRLPDSESILKLKELLEDKFGVSVKNQKLGGWKDREHLVTDETRLLRDLHLPSHTTLYLLSDDKSSPIKKQQALNKNLKLEIFYDSEPDSKIHQLQYESEKKFSDLKMSLYKLTRVIPNHQDWFLKLNENDTEFQQICLNDLFSDDSRLNDIIELLGDNLDRIFMRIKPKIRYSQEESSETTKQATKINNENDDENDVLIEHSMDDDDDDDDIHVVLNKKKTPMIPKNTDNEFDGTNHFDQEFMNRYGPLKPLFFIGSLEDASKEALMCSAKSRKLLGIYLHSDNTIFANIFCSKVFSDEAIIAFLSANFVVWPWDLTHESNEKHFYQICQSYLGSLATTTIKSCKNKLPAFLVVTRVRGNNEIVAVVEGDSTKESMINSLMQSYEIFEQQRLKDEQDEAQREERERIKREQDLAYQSSLESDKAKRQRQASESEKKMKEELEEKKRLEDIETRKKEHASRVPTEPTSGDIARIRFKLPSGEVIERKFFKTNTLSAIIDLISSLGYFSETYKLLSTWPRRDLTQVDCTQTLEQLKLYPQETLMIEEK